jgi:TRAP transporter 4TM/12TM fusion protein
MEEKKILEQYELEARYRTFDSVFISRIVSLLAVGLASFHLITSYTGPLITLQHRVLHVGVVMMLVFLLYPAKRTSPKTVPSIFDWMLALISFVTIIYIFLDYSGIVARSGAPNDSDVILGLLFVLLVIEGGRRILGKGLTILCIIFLIYAYLGPYLPSIIGHRGYTISDIANYMYLTTEGILGTAVGVSATYIFLFMLFGAFLDRTGMGNLFNDASMAIAGHTAGGPAKVAVLSSGFLGSINGSAIANVVTTGAFTIPLMKRTGYSSNYAGAVEAASSVGGQILPPVMGATAFIMAETLGVPYSKIAIAAIIPGLLYYFGIIVMVHLQAKKQGLKGISREDLPKIKNVLRERGHLLIPLLLLIYMLFSGYTPIYAAFFAIIAIVAISALRYNTRIGIKGIIEALEKGTRSALSVAMACAMVGIIVGVASLTGLGLKMTNAILVLGQGSLFLTLFYAMIASIILGMGLPSIPTYIITSSMTAPALMEFGVEPFVSHMFVFYFGILANLTPPVALAAFAGAGIAGGNPNKTGFLALKLASAGVLVPYIFVYSPELLLLKGTPISIGWATITALVGVVSLGITLEGYLTRPLSILWRVLAFIAAITLIIPGLITDTIGLSILLLLLLRSYLDRKKTDHSIANNNYSSLQ